MWAWLKILFGTVPVIGKIIDWFDGRKHDQMLKSQIEAEEDAQILKGVKRAKDITSKPLPDDLLVSPEQRGHNQD